MKIEPGFTINCLDHGYVKYLDHMGSDETFVEAARMSTGKGFLGWYWEEDTYDKDGKLLGKKGQPRDINLLNTLYSNRHSSPFEMGEVAIEVYAPLVTMREWHRHRTQAYNEFSGRYSEMPDVHYVPERYRMQEQSKTNNQGSGKELPEDVSEVIIHSMLDDQDQIYQNYQSYLGKGLAKELARLNTPLSRYTKMRAKTDVRNWLGFLLLRMDKAAQYEIRVYANAVAQIIKALFPKTYDLFLEHDLLGTRLSRTEAAAIRNLFGVLDENQLELAASAAGMTKKQYTAFLNKLRENKEEEYKNVI
jgi:thymidylate synthase (FAD)